MSVQKELYEQAIALGMCNDFKEHWDKYGEDITLAQLCDMYHRGLDFCIKHDFPSVEFMDKHLKGEIEKYGIYVNVKDSDGAHDTTNIVINGDSEICVKAVGKTIDITVRHDSTVIIEAHENAFVYVSMYDNSRLIVRYKDSSSRICVSHFGGTIETPELVDKVYKK